MDVGRRAKQFAPFAALRGLDETIRQGGFDFPLVR